MIPPTPEDVTTVANKVVGTGSAVTVMGWIASSDFGFWVGVLIGVIGLLINFHYSRRHDRRADEAHRVYIARLQEMSDSHFMDHKPLNEK